MPKWIWPISIMLATTITGMVPNSVQAMNTKCPIVIAHKGYHYPYGIYPENSIAAINAAHNEHAKWIETDTMLSRSGYPIIMHGGNVFYNVTGRSGTPANYWTWDLTHMRLRNAPGMPFTNQHIPTMLQYLWQVKRDHMNVEIEVTSTWNAKEMATYIRILKSVQARYYVRVSGWSVKTLAYIRHAYTGMKTDLLTASFWPAPSNGIGGSMQEDALLGYLSMAKVKMLMNSGIRVDIWTPDTRQSIMDALALHPTMITTDRLPLYHQLSGC